MGAIQEGPPAPAGGAGGRRRGIRVRKAVTTTTLAVAGLGVSTYYGGLLGTPGSRHPWVDRAVAIGSAVVFLVFALVAVRGATDDLLSLVPHDRFGDTRITTLRVLCLLTGYALVVLGGLSLLHVPWSRLILGGALTGVIVGIAAQPVLGNIFAGLVLLTARPFQVGHEVAVQSGALGGRIEGHVTDMTLLFVQLRTSQGPVLLPNSAVLGAAISPPAVRPVRPADPGWLPGDRGTGRVAGAPGEAPGSAGTGGAGAGDGGPSVPGEGPAGPGTGGGPTL